MPTSYLNKLRNWLESIPERFNLQPKQEWSEEDEKRIQSILFSIGYCKDEYPNKKDYLKDIAWLKALPLSLKKKNEDVAKLCSNEWSEEDRTMINHIIEALPKWANGLITILPSQAEEYAKRLKSLRPSWKPGEEQMNALENVIKCELSAGLHTRARILQTLQNDLKKL